MSKKRQSISLVVKTASSAATKEGTDTRRTRGVGTGTARPPGSIDWPAVRRDYATGKLSNVGLCRRHSLLPTTLSRRIRRDQQRDPTTWRRNLTGQVRDTTAALLLQEHASGILKAGNEAAVVLAAAAVNRDVILGHRRDIARVRHIWTGLLAELEATTTSPQQLAAMLAQAGQHLDEAGRAALAAQHAQLMQLHQRVGSIQRLADATIKLQAAERKAFGLKDEDGGSDPLDQMSEAELEAQIQALEAERVAGGPALKLVKGG